MIQLLKVLSWILVFVPILNYIDCRVTRNGDKPNYLLYFILRGGAYILWGILVVHEPLDNRDNIREIVVTLGYAICSFWVEYELIRNWWSKRALLYYDIIEKDSGIIDRFFAWAGREAHLVAKLIALVLAIQFGINCYYL